MDALIAAAARALATGDPLAALNRIALRDDAAALALRGIAMAQLGDLSRARELLRGAARAFGHQHPVARARCVVAEAEIALVSRDLGHPSQALQAARSTLAASGDRANAAHAGYLEARRLLLIGRLDEANAVLNEIDVGDLPRPSKVGRNLVVAGLAIRRIKAGPARAALERARRIAGATGIHALMSEVDEATRSFEAPVARFIAEGAGRLLRLDEVETLLASNAVVVDCCRNVVRAGTEVLPLATRPVLLTLARALAEAWPLDVPRETLVKRAFRAQDADDSHRARLRVEIGRLREALEPLATVSATRRGFVLNPHGREVGVLAPPVEHEYADVLALLADGQAWSSSGLALALNVSTRTVQRALEELALAGKAESFGRGRACRWIASGVPGFPTSLLLPAINPSL